MSTEQDPLSSVAVDQLVGRRIRGYEVMKKGSWYCGKRLDRDLTLWSEGVIIKAQPCAVHRPYLTAMIEVDAGHLKSAYNTGRYGHTHYWHSLVPGTYDLL